MTDSRNGWPIQCVVIDLGTQFDFCDARGACPVANVDDLIPALRHMIAWAKRNLTPVISSLEAHRRSETLDGACSDICCDGTRGQRKIDFTIFPQSVQVEVDNTLSCPLDLYRQYQQVIFRKRTEDFFENPKADRLLTELRVKEFIVFGIGLETSIKALSLGLVARQKQVTVVVDACGYWNRGRAELARRQMIAKGVNITTIDELLQRRLPRDHRPWASFVRKSNASTNGRHNGRPNGRQNGRPAGNNGHPKPPEPLA